MQENVGGVVVVVVVVAILIHRRSFTAVFITEKKPCFTLFFTNAKRNGVII